MVKLELYRVFREVAEAGNISLAAENLYLSQSAVSQSVKQLEQQLGTRLFLRSPRGVTLTEDGRLLFEYVRSAMGLLETGENKLQQSRTLQAGTLVIGASDTVTSQFRAGRVDIAFASAPGDADDLEHIPCFETHSCFVAAPDYPCDFTRAYTTEEIAAFPLILLEKKASSRTYLEKYFLQSGVRLTPEIELGARSLLVDLAKIGFGVAGVTREFVQGELAAGEIRELSTAFSIPPRTVDLCMLRNVSPSAATERFARDVLEKLQGKSVSV